MSIVCILALAAFITAIVSAIGKCPLWVAVVLLSLAVLLQCLPMK